MNPWRLVEEELKRNGAKVFRGFVAAALLSAAVGGLFFYLLPFSW